VKYFGAEERGTRTCRLNSDDDPVYDIGVQEFVYRIFCVLLQFLKRLSGLKGVVSPS